MEKNLIQQLRIKPHYVSLTRDLQSGRQFVKLTFEFEGKLGAFGNFLQSVREDLWDKGLHTNSISFGSPGMSFVSIVPEADPKMMAHPEFSVRERDEMQTDHDAWVAGIDQYLRSRREGG
jgi:hypothetical protein